MIRGSLCLLDGLPSSRKVMQSTPTRRMSRNSSSRAAHLEEQFLYDPSPCGCRSQDITERKRAPPDKALARLQPPLQNLSNANQTLVHAKSET